MEEAAGVREVEAAVMGGLVEKEVMVVVGVVLAEEEDGTTVQAVDSAAGVVVVAVVSATIVAGWVISRGIVIGEMAVRLLAVEGVVDTAVVGVMAAAAAAAAAVVVVTIVEIQDILLGIVKMKANEESGSSFKRYLHLF